MRLQRRLPAPARSASRRLTARHPLALATLVVALGATALVAPASSADEIADKRAQAQQVASQLDSLEERVHQLDEQAELAKGEIAAAEQALAEAQLRADEANAEMEVRQGELRSFAVDAYVSGGNSPAADALFASDSNDASKVRGYLEVTAGNRQDLVDQLQATKQKADEEGERLTAAQADLEARNATVQASLDEAESAVAEQAAIKSKLDGEVATLVAAEQAARAAEEQRQAEERARQQLAQTAQTAQSAPAARTTAPPRSTAPAPVVDTGPPPPIGSGLEGAVAAAMGKIGSPYVWAAAGPNTFDCSGLIMWAFGQVGISLPHYTGSLYNMSRRITLADAQPGDLVFYWAGGARGDPSHAGIYIGGGSFVHAPGRGKFVRVDSVGYWSGATVAYGRL